MAATLNWTPSETGQLPYHAQQGGVNLQRPDRLENGLVRRVPQQLHRSSITRPWEDEYGDRYFSILILPPWTALGRTTTGGECHNAYQQFILATRCGGNSSNATDQSAEINERKWERTTRWKGTKGSFTAEDCIRKC
eukprot:4528710-Karenia_brevis.AAC.1